MVPKLALGTAQLGFRYGINNKVGLLPAEKAYEIIEFAYKRGIDTLDTAFVYGESEKRIGNVRNDIKSNLKIVSKTPMMINGDTLNKFFDISLSRLGLTRIYGYLIHAFNDYINDKTLLHKMHELKEKNAVEKIGFSLYYPSHLELLIDQNVQFDLVQVPFNLADRRFEKYFDILKKKNIEIHTRSVFLQGVFFIEGNKLPPNLKPFSPILGKINKLSRETNRTLQSILLNFVLEKESVDKVIVGIDNIEQLEENLGEVNNMLTTEEVSYIEDELSEIKIPEELLAPSNWF